MVAVQSVIKTGDVHSVTFTVTGPNGVVNLTGATARLIVHRRGSVNPIVLPVTITNPTAGKIIHELDGTLASGIYAVEVEITADGQIFTTPSAGVAWIRIENTLDPND